MSERLLILRYTLNADDIRKADKLGFEEEMDSRKRGSPHRAGRLLERRALTTWWWYIDTGYACGAVVTDALGKIVDAAPIFRKLIGRNVGTIRCRERRRL